jgi:hypothetical protein
VEATEEE